MTETSTNMEMCQPIETVTVTTTESTPFCCPEPGCNKKYPYRSSLNRHKLMCHSVLPDGNTLVKCDQCEMTFKKVHLLQKHSRMAHPIAKAPVHDCCFCELKFPTVPNLYEHWEKNHDVSLKTEQLTFDNFNEFSFWKENIERETKSNFKKITKTTERKEKKHSYYRCHRSGYFKSESKGLRHLKTQGSNKINSVCPASMKVTESLTDNKCFVTYTSTHIGHSNQVKYVPLTLSEREKIAAKIAAQMPFDVILDEVKSDISSDLERLHLLRKKDLHNIQQQFKLKKYPSVRQKKERKSRTKKQSLNNNPPATFYIPQSFQDDSSSVSAGHEDYEETSFAVSEIQSFGESFYKPQSVMHLTKASCASTSIEAKFKKLAKEFNDLLSDKRFHTEEHFKVASQVLQQLKANSTGSAGWSPKRQFRSHTGVAYACQMCNKTFAQTASLQRHLLTHTRNINNGFPM